MYLAQTNTLETQAPFYANILQDIIDNKNMGNKESIDNAIKEAKKVILGEKNIYSIDNNHYFFITTLLLNYKDKLIEVNDNKINNQTYIDILNLL